jgi:D-alanyl-D-alanine carboxypeptidase (penicillin-binding protein 5/6)
MGKVSAKLDYKAPLMAPVVKGQEIGRLKVQIGSSTEVQSFPVYAGADVPETGFIGGLFQKLKYMAGGAPAVN